LGLLEGVKEAESPTVALPKSMVCVTPHIMRHSFASNLATAGISSSVFGLLRCQEGGHHVEK
jgi:hypothetical protein